MNPQKGEIWIIDFDPTTGSEINKKRPAVVIGSDAIGILPLRIIVPITSWQDKFSNAPWLVKIPAAQKNGLSNDSAADSFQIKSVSIKRFKKKLGVISAEKVKEVIMGVMICLGVK